MVLLLCLKTTHPLHGLYLYVNGKTRLIVCLTRRLRAVAWGRWKLDTLEASAGWTKQQRGKKRLARLVGCRGGCADWIYTVCPVDTMGKTRMSVLDVRVQAGEIHRRLVGARVANIYDLNGRTYVLKLSVPPPRPSTRRDLPATAGHDAGEETTTGHIQETTALCEKTVAADIQATAAAADVEEKDSALDVSGTVVGGKSTTGDGQTVTADTMAKLPVADSKVQNKTSAASDGWQKVLLLIESGARIHTTEFERDHGAVPSGFCLKLRKHIRTRRLDNVQQLGNDRVIALTFSGGGAVVAHLVVEFYAGGNVILTGPDYHILALLRTLRSRDAATTTTTEDQPGTGDQPIIAGDNSLQPPNDMKLRSLGVKDRYPIEGARAPDFLTLAVVERGIREALDNVPTEATIAACAGRSARKKLKAGTEARKALATSMAFGPQVLEHALVRAGLNPNCSLYELRGNDEAVRKVFIGLQEVERMIGFGAEPEATVESNEKNTIGKRTQQKGYVFLKQSEVAGRATDVFDDFSPFLLAQYRDRCFKEFETFDDAVDTYFANLEMGRAEAAKVKREAAAYKKVDKLTAELKGQVSALEMTQESSEQKALAIESNIVEVDAALKVTQSAIAAAVDWDDLARMVEEEKKNGNPVAQIIHSLHLQRNSITLMLEDSWGWADADDPDDAVEDVESSDDDDEVGDIDDNGDVPSDSRQRSNRLERSAASRKVLLIDVDLGLSAHANAREYYAMKKTAAMKKEKAVEATDRTIRAASKKAAIEAKKMEADAAVTSIRARRKPYWFEKFHWMISSENYLIVAGRDAQQNELLVKRYMGPWDAYVHADVHGAASVVVKNHKPSGAARYADIPRISLEQAGTFAMCRSSAWDAKVVTSAWWVRASQVSKTPPTGLSLATGSFVIRGKKNFLDPSQLVMGFAFLFKVDESCVARHRGERVVRGQNDSFPEQPLRSNDSALASASPEEEFDNDDEVVIVSTCAVIEDVHSENRADIDASEIGVMSDGTMKGNDNGSDRRNHHESIDADNDLTPNDESGVKGNISHNQSSNPNPNIVESVGNMDENLFARFATLSNEIDRSNRGLVDSTAGQVFSRFDPPDCNISHAGFEDGKTDSKYGFSQEMEEPEDVGSQKDEASDSRPSKRRMSAKERRKLKSGVTSSGEPFESSDDPANMAEATSNEACKALSAIHVSSSRNFSTSQTGQGPLPRGKRSKLKKIKKKYGEQEEEERAIALTVLGAKKVKEMDGPGVATSEQGDEGDQAQDKQCIEDVKGSKQVAAQPPRISRRQDKKDVIRLMDEEGIEELNELEKESLDVLSMLTANPFPDDIVQYALPICAPYNALSGYRYRAKLLPGAVKRGKAYRSALVLFLRQAEKDMRSFVQERDAMRATPENDAVHMMLGNVRVMAPGLAEAQRGRKMRGKK
jgi:predicted ribosome quality control (RQC) complex YloA/Tae2 family protein